jgi:hypothetical protein
MDNKIKQKSGFQKKIEKRAALLSAAGSDSKQRKLDFFSKYSSNKNQNENVTDITDQPNPIEKSANDNNELRSNVTSENTIKSSYIFPILSRSSEQDQSNVIINDNDIFSSSESESEKKNTKKLIETDSKISLFIPPIFSSHHQAKVAFVDAHPCQPQINIPFNINKVYYRKMPNDNFVNRKWVSYNSITRKIHCSLCMGFTRPGSTPFIDGIEINLKHLYSQLEKHESSVPHDDACKAYLNITSGHTITNALLSHRQKSVELNREIVTRIIDISLLIGKQGLAFRSKKNEAAYNLSLNLKQGNFLEIVKLVAKYDPVLQTHLNNSIKKSLLKKEKKQFGRGSCVTFLSKTFLNKIFSITGNLIKKHISEEVLLAGQYSLEVDSSQDTSVMDQLCICIRYVLNGKIIERMIALVESTSGTGEALYNIVKKELDTLNIPLTKLIGESFDGAANMSGSYNGLQAHLKTVAPESIYTHCHAHVLNLIVTDATSCCKSAQDLFNLLQKTAVFFSDSYKRTGIWKNYLSKDQTGNDKLRKLQKLGTTRWNSKDAALKCIFGSWFVSGETSDRYNVLVESLHFLDTDSSIDSNTSSDARFLLEKWTSFEYILTSFIFLEIFHYTTPASKYLQSKELDFITVINLIKSLLSDLKKGSSKYDLIVEKTMNFISSKNNSEHIKKLNIVIEETFPDKRRSKIKKMPGELASDDIRNISNVEYFKVNTHRRIYDVLITTFENRFEKNEKLYDVLSILNPKRFKDFAKNPLLINDENLTFIAQKSNIESGNTLKEELLQFISFYNQNCIKSITNNTINTENTSENSAESSDDIIENSCQYTENKVDCYSCPSHLLEFLYKYNLHTSSFTNLYLAYKYIITLSCTQVNCERAFSKLKIIKTRLRSTMKEELLESLMLISVESDVIPTTNKIIDTIGRSSTVLSNLLIS